MHIVAGHMILDAPILANGAPGGAGGTVVIRATALNTTAQASIEAYGEATGFTIGIININIISI